jgi:predicted nucleotidyltransferase
MNPVAKPLLEAHRARIAELCRRHHVARLELFGSATGDKFFTAASDFDFLVRFRPGPPQGVADAYLGLAEGLEKLLGRPVDLVTEDSVRNPYFRASLNSSRELVYDDQRSQEVAV